MAHTFGHQAHAGSCRISCCTWASHSFTDASHSKGWSCAETIRIRQTSENKSELRPCERWVNIFNPLFVTYCNHIPPLISSLNMCLNHFKHNFSWFFRQSFSCGALAPTSPTMPSVYTTKRLASARQTWHRGTEQLRTQEVWHMTQLWYLKKYTHT